MAEREYLTRRGELLSRLEWSKVGPGEYLVEGYQIAKRGDGYWTIDRVSHGRAAVAMTFTDALDFVADSVDRTRS